MSEFQYALTVLAVAGVLGLAILAAVITVVVGGIFRFQTKHATISAKSVKPTLLNQSKAEVQAEPVVQVKANPRQQQKSRGAGGSKPRPKPQDIEQADGDVA